jgi:hypothetical protein
MRRVSAVSGEWVAEVSAWISNWLSLPERAEGVGFNGVACAGSRAARESRRPAYLPLPQARK